MIRDILTAEIPFILRHRQLYATAAMAGVGVYLLLGWVGAPSALSSLLGMLTTFSLRLASIYLDVRVPAFEYRGGADDA
jgi:uncharacterized membrane protein YeiH